MTPEEKLDVLHKISVMQAYIDGKTIETCDLCDNDNEEAWEKVEYPIWSWGFFDYRVAPEEMEKMMKEAIVEIENISQQDFLISKSWDSKKL